MVAAYLSGNYVIQKAWTQTLEARAGGDATKFLADTAEDVVYERGHLNAPSRESGDEKCLLPKAAQFVVQWRHGYKERESLCVRHEVPLGVGTEVSEVDTAGRDQRSGERVVQRDSTIPRV